MRHHLSKINRGIVLLSSLILSLSAMVLVMLPYTPQTFARSSNDDMIDDDFWVNELPLQVDTTGFIIEALYADGNIGMDTSFYTQYRQTNSCDTSTMNLVWLSPGTDTIPQTLSADTVYVAQVGQYDLTYNSIYIGGDCVAFVGENTSTSTGDMARLFFEGGFNIASGFQNTIIANIHIGRTGGYTDIGIHGSGIINSSFWPWYIADYSESIYIENSDYIFVGGDIGHNNSSPSPGQAIAIRDSNNIWIGTQDYTAAAVDAPVGLSIYDTNDVVVHADVRDNDLVGAFIENTTNITINGGVRDNNGSGEIVPPMLIGGLYITGSSDITINSGTYTNNDGDGIALYDITNVVMSGVTSINNITHGIEIRSGSNITGTNVIASNNNNGSDNGLYIYEVSNVFMQNITANTNGAYGISLGYVSNITMQDVIANNNVGGLDGSQINNGIFIALTGTNNIANGLEISNSNNIDISDIYTLQNGTNGINISLSTGVLGENIHNEANGVDGLSISESENIALTGVVSLGNSDDGMDIATNVSGISLVDYILQENDGLGLDITEGTQYGNFVSGTLSTNQAGGVSVNDGSSYHTFQDLQTYTNDFFGIEINNAEHTIRNNVRTYDNMGDGWIMTLADNHTGQFVYSYGNIEDGLYIDTSQKIFMQHLHTYNNDQYGIFLTNNASNNIFDHVVSFGNGRNGIDVNLGSNNNSIKNIQAYANGINGLEVDSSSENMVHNIASYNNVDMGIALEDDAICNTINNFAVFNNSGGIDAYANGAMTIANNAFNNGAVFNNSARGIGLGAQQVNNASGNVFNNINTYNNVTGFMIRNNANDNFYYGILKLFANDTSFDGTNGSDSSLTAGGLLPIWSVGSLDTTSRPMTCNRAIQAENIGYSALLSYPLCDLRGYQGARAVNPNVRYTYFSEISLQIQPVACDNGNITNSGSYESVMHVSDYVFSGTQAYGAHMVANENNDYTYNSGGIIYRNSIYPFAAQIFANNNDNNYIITGVNDINFDGIFPGTMGSFGFSSAIFNPSWINQNRIQIMRFGINTGDNESNYYALMRGIYIDDISIDKQAHTGQVYPGQEIGYTITLINSGGSAGSGMLIDYLPVGLDTGTLQANPIGVYSGSINGYVREFTGLDENTGYTFYLTATVDIGFNGTLINTGSYVSDYTSNGNGWSGNSTTAVTVLPPVNGTCGTAATNSHYGQQTLNSGTIDLCGQGIATGFAGPNSTGEYTWTCMGLYGGNNIQCNADENRCTDGNFDAGPEQCDDGNSNDYDTCTNTCTLYAPTCILEGVPSTGNAPLNTTLSGSASTGMTMQYFDYGDGTTGASINHVYTIAGIYTVTGYAVNQYSGALTTMCTTQINVNGTYCGDGTPQSPNSFAQYEQCDDGNTDDYDGCSSVCTREPSLCSVLLQPGFIIQNASTGINGSGNMYLSGLYLTDISTGVNPIVDYQWDIVSTGLIVVDSGIIVAGQGTPNVVFDFTNIDLGVGGSVIQFIVTITDSLGNTGQSTQFFRYDDGFYGIFTDILTGHSISGTVFNGSGQFVASYWSGGVTGVSYTSVLSDFGIVANNASYIDYTGDLIQDTGFVYVGMPYDINYQYTTGLNILTLFADVGSVGNSLNVGSTSYPMMCNNICGDGVRNTGEQCDDGNQDDTDACSNACMVQGGSCQIQVTPTTGFVPFNTTITTTYTTGFTIEYFEYGDGTTGTNPNYIYNTPGNYGITAYVSNIWSGTIMNNCNAGVQVSAQPYCGDGFMQTPNTSGFNEQCDDGNTDDYDGCTVMCQTNTCSTTVLGILDPKIVYQFGYYTDTPTTGMIFTFTTPTTGINYSYNRSISGVNTTNLSGFSIIGSNTGTVMQMMTEQDPLTGDFSFIISLEVTNGILTGSIEGSLSCNTNGFCQFSYVDYGFNQMSGFTTQGIYQSALVGQSAIIHTGIQDVLYAYQVSVGPPVERQISIYACDVYDRVAQADQQGFFETGALAFTSGDFLDMYENNTLPEQIQFICDPSSYPRQANLMSSDNVAYILAYTDGSVAQGVQTQTFGPYNYIVNSGQNIDTIIFDIGFGVTNNVGIQYYNSCTPICGNNIDEIGEQCDDGNIVDGDACSSTCNLEPITCGSATPIPGVYSSNGFKVMPASGYANITTFDIQLGVPVRLTTGYYLDYGNGTTGTNTGYMYTTSGSFTITGYFTHPYSGSVIEICSDTVDVYVANICGDGFIQTPNMSGFNEQCDDANQNNNDACSNTCTLNTPACTLSVLPTTGTVPLQVNFSPNATAGATLVSMSYGNGITGTNFASYTYATTGTFVPVLTVRNSLSGSITAICTGATITVNNTPTVTPPPPPAPICGNGIVESGEQCDGSSNCRSNCTRRTSNPPTSDKDYCPDGDFSSSYYDDTCGKRTQHSSAEILEKYRIIHGDYNNGPNSPELYKLDRFLKRSELRKMMVRTLTDEKYTDPHQGETWADRYAYDLHTKLRFTYGKNYANDKVVTVLDGVNIIIKGLQYLGKMSPNFELTSFPGGGRTLKRGEMMALIVRFVLPGALDVVLQDIQNARK